MSSVGFVDVVEVIEQPMPGWVTGICNANGIEVHYRRTGGDKPPVVLLHGLAADGACWTPLARALENNYDVVMPDARGHGRSDSPDDRYRYEALAEDVLGLIGALGLAGPVLLGHSMGGMTAAVVASKNPRCLRGLVLADPTFLTPQRQREVYASDAVEQHRRTLSRTKEDLLAELRARHPRRSPEIVEHIARARLQTSLRAFDVLTPPNPDYVPLIETLDVPSLLILGDVGSVVSRETAAKLAALNPRLKVEPIAEAGHGLPYDEPERFSAAVQAFLRSVTG
jgi:pimeloyl-ACP methyl ester carboxylesterase